jgi:hypothetical protein
MTRSIPASNGILLLFMRPSVVEKGWFRQTMVIDHCLAKPALLNYAWAHE